MVVDGIGGGCVVDAVSSVLLLSSLQRSNSKNLRRLSDALLTADSRYVLF